MLSMLVEKTIHISRYFLLHSSRLCVLRIKNRARHGMARIVDGMAERPGVGRGVAWVSGGTKYAMLVGAGLLAMVLACGITMGLIINF